MRDIAYIALGSNLGDRDALLASARDAMGRLPDTRIVATSDIEETEPFGPVAQPRFLNQMVALETALTPRQLLEHLLQIERSAGRVRRERWGPRTLDLDIVKYERQTCSDEDLTVPHPGLATRPFWQRQLASLVTSPAPKR
jgi:2-amino-4-hydroxy-6-hydroxymethyldihydropteridine diphosphokinase